MRVASIAWTLLLVSAAGAARAADSLPRLVLEPGSLTVSGVSAGGYMATQVQVAHSRDVIGAGIVGAGPWLCAQGVISRALKDCTEGDVAGPDERPLVAALRASAAAKAVDDPSWLAPDRVWVFHGGKDVTIGAAVSDSLVRFYRAFLPPERIRYETQVPAAHGMPTLADGGDCGTAEAPWILACRYDAAGEMLQYLYDGLSAPVGAITGELREFDQSKYVSGGALASMADTGFLFVPKDCSAGKPCRIHVAFHGCGQGIGFVGRRFAKVAGYNRWADANRIVVLFPQAEKSWFWPFNPRGCWDWWGYSGPSYASRDGLQVRAVWRMVQALGGTVP